MSDLEELTMQLAIADLDSDSDGAPSSPSPGSTAGTSPAGNIETFCKECEQNSAVWYCEKCGAICEECWDDRKPHRRNDPQHSRIPYKD
jgi:hypothetical protein